MFSVGRILRRWNLPKLFGPWQYTIYLIITPILIERLQLSLTTSLTSAHIDKLHNLAPVAINLVCSLCALTRSLSLIGCCLVFFHDNHSARIYGLRLITSAFRNTLQKRGSIVGTVFPLHYVVRQTARGGQEAKGDWSWTDGNGCNHFRRRQPAFRRRFALARPSRFFITYGFGFGGGIYLQMSVKTSHNEKSKKDAAIKAGKFASLLLQHIYWFATDANY